MIFLLASALSIWAVDAFAPAGHAVPTHCSSSTRLLAASGPPQYEKFHATLRLAEEVGEGSVMLHVETEDEIEYEPGHVLALEMRSSDEDPPDAESKAQEDAKANGGWMRGPYTVSRSTERSLDVLIKAVGEKSGRFASAAPGTPVRFGGKFHVPILEGVDAETTERVVMISTGVGAGPCVGAIEKATESGSSFPPIHLIASYRTEGELVYADHLDDLQKECPGRFSWEAIVTSERGRLSSGDNLKELGNVISDSAPGRTHYHLIGNGQMVSEFKEGLQKAGVADDKVTVEMYFNHRAEVDAEAVERIAAAVKEAVSSPVA